MNPDQPVDWRQCFFDRWFYLSLAAGPFVWVGLKLLGFASGFALPALSLLMLRVLVYPVLEEIVFRGALQGWLRGFSFLSRSVLPGITLANILVSVVFSSLHLISQHPLWAALIFVPSLVFGWARDRYESLIAPILLHAFYNAGFLFLVFN